MHVSTRVFIAEAQDMGFKIEVIDEDLSFFKLSSDSKSVYIKASKIPLNSCIAERITGDKYMTRIILEREGLPMAPGICVKPGTEDSLEEQIKDLNYPLVVKPARGDCGVGVVTKIENLEELNKAVAQANKYEVDKYGKYGSGAIVEEMLQGEEYRIVVVGDEVVAVTQRIPANIIGDGQSTIQELVAKKNEWLLNRYDSYKTAKIKPTITIPQDDIATEFLKKQNLNWDSVPAKDEQIFLRKNSNISTGGEAIDRTDDLCQTNKDMAVAAAKAIQGELVGVDFMTPDLTKPWSETPGSGIVELNCTIGISLQHLPHQGTPRNVSKAIIERLVKNNYL